MTTLQIDIYTDILCSYCALAKQMLKSKQVTFNEIDISRDSKKRDEMRSRANGQRTVPQIFIDDIHIGGYDDLYALDNNGLLDTLLARQREEPEN